MEQSVHVALAALAAAERWLAAPIQAGQLRRLGSAEDASRSRQRVAEGRILASRVAPPGDANLAMETQLQWWPLAISVGRLTTMRTLIRAVRRPIGPDRASMTWWSGGSVDTGGYRRALGFRMAASALSALDATALHVRLRPFMRLTGRLVERMKLLTPSDRARGA